MKTGIPETVSIYDYSNKVFENMFVPFDNPLNIFFPALMRWGLSQSA